MLRIFGRLVGALLILSLSCTRADQRELTLAELPSDGAPGTTAPAGPQHAVAPAVAIAPPPGSPELPALRQLPRQGSAASGDRRLSGAEYDAALPKARVFAAPPDLSYAPAGADLSGAAYAVFHFDLPGYSGQGSIETVWDTPPLPTDYYIGVADFALNSWQWFNVDPTDPLVLPGGVEFMSPTDQVYVVVLLTGTAVHALQEVGFGGDLPPTAVLRVQYHFAEAGTTIDFDAGASSDDNMIAQYEWDLDGDGSFELDGGTDPTASKLYPLATTLTVQLRVTDDAGQSSVASIELRIDNAGYDETEPNNDVASADQLPALGFAGWDGNLGPGGYDGGGHDYYRFSVDEPMHVVFALAEFTPELFKLAIYDSSGTVLVRNGDYMTENVNLFHNFTAPGTFILDVEGSSSMSSDYSLSAHVQYGNGYDEVEPNNTLAEANLLDGAGVANLWGNLGAGGYDGGSEDWYYVSVDMPGQYYTFTLDYDVSEVNLDLELTDGVNVLASRAGDGNHEYLSYGFVDPGDYYLRVFVHPGGDPGAQGDYLLHLTDNGLMPEVQLQATPDSGGRPLTVSFDASGSTIPPDNYVVQYYWDLNGDGIAEFTTPGGIPFAEATYYAGNSYTARVQLELGTGAFGMGEVQIVASGAPSEVEPNNEFASAQALPAFPFSNFFGDVGPGGYDGLSQDVYAFTLASNEGVAFNLDYQPWFILVGALIVAYDGAEETILVESYENDGNEYVTYFNGSAAPQALYFQVISDPEWPGGFGGYTLGGVKF